MVKKKIILGPELFFSRQVLQSFISVIQDCWSQDPKKRPTPVQLWTTLQEMMEKYSPGLSKLVVSDKGTEWLEREKERGKAEEEWEEESDGGGMEVVSMVRTTVGEIEVGGHGKEQPEQVFFFFSGKNSNFMIN